MIPMAGRIPITVLFLFILSLLGTGHRGSSGKNTAEWRNENPRFLAEGLGKEPPGIWEVPGGSWRRGNSRE